MQAIQMRRICLGSPLRRGGGGAQVHHIVQQYKHWPCSTAACTLSRHHPEDQAESNVLIRQPCQDLDAERGGHAQAETNRVSSESVKFASNGLRSIHCNHRLTLMIDELSIYPQSTSRYYKTCWTCPSLSYTFRVSRHTTEGFSYALEAKTLSRTGARPACFVIL